jgi:hypothetical protein
MIQNLFKIILIMGVILTPLTASNQEFLKIVENTIAQKRLQADKTATIQCGDSHAKVHTKVYVDDKTVENISDIFVNLDLDSLPPFFKAFVGNGNGQMNLKMYGLTMEGRLFAYVGPRRHKKSLSNMMEFLAKHEIRPAKLYKDKSGSKQKQNMLKGLSKHDVVIIPSKLDWGDLESYKDFIQSVKEKEARVFSLNNPKIHEVIPGIHLYRRITNLEFTQNFSHQKIKDFFEAIHQLHRVFEDKTFYGSRNTIKDIAQELHPKMAKHRSIKNEVNLLNREHLVDMLELVLEAGLIKVSKASPKTWYLAMQDDPEKLSIESFKKLIMKASKQKGINSKKVEKACKKLEKQFPKIKANLKKVIKHIPHQVALTVKNNRLHRAIFELSVNIPKMNIAGFSSFSIKAQSEMSYKNIPVATKGYDEAIDMSIIAKGFTGVFGNFIKKWKKNKKMWKKLRRKRKLNKKPCSSCDLH